MPRSHSSADVFVNTGRPSTAPACVLVGKKTLSRTGYDLSRAAHDDVVRYRHSGGICPAEYKVRRAPLLEACSAQAQTSSHATALHVRRVAQAVRPPDTMNQIVALCPQRSLTLTLLLVCSAAEHRAPRRAAAGRRRRADARVQGQLLRRSQQLPGQPGARPHVGHPHGPRLSTAWLPPPVALRPL